MMMMVGCCGREVENSIAVVIAQLVWKVFEWFDGWMHGKS